MFSDTKIFRYHYLFESRLLVGFIRDRYFKKKSLPEIHHLIEERVQLNGLPADASTIINPGDWLEYTHKRSDESELAFIPDIVYEDDHLIAISKPDFLPVIPNSSYYYNSLAILMKERFKTAELSPTHRLDIETGGVLLFGKTKSACREVQMLFQNRKVEKKYQAVTASRADCEQIAGDLIPDTDSKIFTKQKLQPSSNPGSITRILKQEPWGNYFRVWLNPITGKTNQIRVHLAAVGCPIVGDKKYYADEEVFLAWLSHRDIHRVIDKLTLTRQALHCESLKFIHPFSSKEIVIEDTTQFWENKISVLQ